MKPFVPIGLFVSGALAQSGAWGQCGGQGWTGQTTCVSGYVCTYSNPWYSQCLPGTGSTTAASTSAASSTFVTSTKTSSSATSTSTGSPSLGWKWFGVDESCAEFGQNNIPGTYGKDFIFPSESSISTLISAKYNIFRVPFLMERMVPSTLTSSLDAAYLANYTATINYITNAGAWAVIDPHNFGRYYGNVITDTAGFQSFWTQLAGNFKSANVIFDTNNEFHDMDQTLVFNLNQAAINGIRAAGATSQYIFVEGNSWSGAWTWNVTNTNLVSLSDSENKIIYEMHQYLDSDGSGTSDSCVSSDIGVQRVSGATAWLKANGKLGVLGEFAGGANSVCQTAVKGLLDHLKSNSDVWTGALWWAGGPWWGDYIYSFEPPSGTAYTYYNSLLQTYAP
ncbi:Glycoside hydrolase family 5 protein [Pleurostoma richardsiae]|uniref:cellulase n=1 Tax=Pleurostoma richardsiae TaxID=41990 RepID=A0AA38RM91_9PEZI|nr:Glycoside hydrolase family 5 protein [Pleurostoma richardsiae]